MPKHPDYDYAADGELFVVRWHQASVGALEHLDGRLTAHRRAVGKPLYYVAVMHADAPHPDEAVRARLLDALAAQHGNLAVARVVILGSGVRVVLMRSGMTAMMLLASRRGHPFRVDKNLRVTAEHIAKQLGRDPNKTLAWLQASGLVGADELD
jgi:uncharacterized NAD(P)/FAD-binding protein YdhS